MGRHQGSTYTQVVFQVYVWGEGGSTIEYTCRCIRSNETRGGSTASTATSMDTILVCTSTFVARVDAIYIIDNNDGLP